MTLNAHADFIEKAFHEFLDKVSDHAKLTGDKVGCDNAFGVFMDKMTMFHLAEGWKDKAA